MANSSKQDQDLEAINQDDDGKHVDVSTQKLEFLHNNVFKSNASAVQLVKEDVDLLVKELEIERSVAEHALIKHNSNMGDTIAYLLRV